MSLIKSAKRKIKKTIIQIRAIKLLAGIATFIMLYGGSRSGKTFIIVYAIIVRASKKKSRHVILRHRFNAVKTAIWMDTLPKVVSLAFPELKESWFRRNKTDFCWVLPNGSEIWISGLDDEKRVEKILGKEYSTMYFNECSEIVYSSIEIAITRLAENSGLTPKVYMDMNPPTKRHWSYALFIKFLDPTSNEPVEDENEYASMVMNPKDNVENLSKGYLKRLSRLSEEMRARFESGEFQDASDGEAYYAFVRDKHVKETPKAVGSLLIGMDFNVDPMTAVICQYINGIFYIHDEVFLRNSDTFKMSDALIKKNYRGLVIPDSTGKNRKTSGKSDHQILKDYGFRIPNGVRNPYVSDRVNNVNRLLTEGRIIINPRCKKLIGDLEKVVWKNNSLDQKSTPEAKLLTHISDCLGYVCWHIDPITGYGEEVSITKMR